MSENKVAIGFGIASKNNNGDWLETYYPFPMINPSEALLTDLRSITLSAEGQNATVELFSKDLNDLIDKLDKHPETKSWLYQGMEWMSSVQPIVLVISELQRPPETVPEIYLHLHLLSHRMVKPHGLCLEGIFGKLPNVAWTNLGPIDVTELKGRVAEARGQGKFIAVKSVDKFPQMTDYVVPAGVRIGDASRIRLGAYLGEGTTVMHEGFVNFNAGTLGTGMIEGRISAGVVVGAGTDIGGGASTMGTLSGGNAVIISLGENCLVGANAGVGIPLGDRCTVEAGLYVTGGSKVSVLDDQGKEVKKAKAGELAGMNDLLFRRNSISGAIECLTNKKAIALNEELHSNN